MVFYPFCVKLYIEQSMDDTHASVLYWEIDNQYTSHLQKSTPCKEIFFHDLSELCLRLRSSY